MSEWSPLKQKALGNIVSQLSTLGTQFKIIAPDGAQYGELEIVVRVRDKAGKVKPKYPRNAMRDYVAAYLDTLKPGDEVFIPTGEYDLASVQAAASSRAFVNWGPKTFITARDKARDGVSVLRIL